ncbi:MAG: hypothetical protein U1F67_24685 [Rubrivivax sp.]
MAVAAVKDEAKKALPARLAQASPLKAQKAPLSTRPALPVKARLLPPRRSALLARHRQH